MEDDAVREIHGVRARKVSDEGVQYVVARESEQSIILVRWDAFENVRLTVWQARYLASRLQHLANRLERRLGPAEAQPPRDNRGRFAKAAA